MALNQQQQLGQQAEQAAVAYLSARGYQVVDRNYVCPQGEVDIVARHGNALVFIEVKARRNTRRGTPREAVTPAKQRKIIAVAGYYMKEKHIRNVPVRFDVMAMMVAGKGFTVELIPHAFPAG
jgi:putative endonuclease